MRHHVLLSSGEYPIRRSASTPPSSSVEFYVATLLKKAAHGTSRKRRMLKKLLGIHEASCEMNRVGGYRARMIAEEAALAREDLQLALEHEFAIRYGALIVRMAR